MLFSSILKCDKMKKIYNLKDLLVEQAQDLYSAEQKQMKVLPKWKDRVRSPKLKEALQRHIDETQKQVSRLDKVFMNLNESPRGKENLCMQSLIDETNRLLDNSGDPQIMDAALITAVQHINHYEIAGYGTTAAYANALEMRDISALLHENLEEEKEIDAELTRLAENEVNMKAKAPIA